MAYVMLTEFGSCGLEISVEEPKKKKKKFKNKKKGTLRNIHLQGLVTILSYELMKSF